MDLQADIQIVRRYEDALTFSVVNGKNALKYERLDSLGHYNDMLIPAVLTLNGVPIVRMQDAVCPTCSGLLAAGYGLSTADAAELSAVSDAVNADFVSIEQSLSVLKPLLGLLPDGVYLLRDTQVYPTDGEGRFFWDVPPEMTDYRAYSSGIYSHESLDTVTTGGAFLYPTQSPARYDAARVQYYTERLAQGESAPRAVAYNKLGGMSALLDGHHKACAAARLHRKLPCLVISPYYLLRHPKREWLACLGENQYELTLTAGCGIPEPLYRMYEEYCRGARKKQFIFSGTALTSQWQARKWEPEYKKAMWYYPTVADYVAEAVCELHSIENLTPAELIAYAAARRPECAAADFSIIALLKKLLRERDPRCRETAMRVARQEVTPENKDAVMEALRCLAAYPDAETEALLIDLVVTGDREIAAAAADSLPDA